jgi:hypothetical protein
MLEPHGFLCNSLVETRRLALDVTGEHEDACKGIAQGFEAALDACQVTLTHVEKSLFGVLVRSDPINESVAFVAQEQDVRRIVV